ncbi:MAG: hypothetical protein Q9223_002412 [Gallowayella weberi]
MFIFSLVTLAALATIPSLHTVCAQRQLHQSPDGALRLFTAGNPRTLWTKINPPAGKRPGGAPGDISYFGITWTDRSKATVSDRDFLLTGVEVLEDIYYNRGKNASDVVIHYQGPTVLMNPPALNISAIGRGVEPDLQITFDTTAMVLFTRWLVQAFQPYKWYEFHCEYGVVVEGKPVTFVVAKGTYTALNLGASGSSARVPPDAQTA